MSLEVVGKKGRNIEKQRVEGKGGGMRGRGRRKEKRKRGGERGREKEREKREESKFKDYYWSGKIKTNYASKGPI